MKKYSSWIATFAKGCWAVLRWCGRNWKFSLITLGVSFIAFFGWRLYKTLQTDEPLFETVHNEAIESTPEEIRSIKAIGQWEFLSITTEELVEKHESHVLGDKHLVKIYKGTLRIGIDLDKAPDDWFRADGTTAILRLPAITILDDNFIDEAHSSTFYEKGTFSAEAKQQMYDEAKSAMMARALTAANVAQARKTAEQQFTNLFTALGYHDVVITFADTPKRQ